jgi:hypothetical protein
MSLWMSEDGSKWGTRICTTNGNNRLIGVLQSDQICLSKVAEIYVQEKQSELAFRAAGDHVGQMLVYLWMVLSLGYPQSQPWVYFLSPLAYHACDAVRRVH